MPDIDWYEIKFLESNSNLKTLIKKSVGRTPSTKVANHIAVCIQQGRLFFEAATASPLQIQPLQVYYGVLAFSRAIILSRRLASIDTLIASHGLTDVSEHNVGIEQLSLKVGARGTFQEFNDTVAALGRIWYFEDTMMNWSSKPFGSADALNGTNISIKELFSRIPNLNQLYEKTFHEQPNTLHVQKYEHSLGPQVDLRIDIPELFTDRESLIGIVKKLRQTYPFLDLWQFFEATLAWNNSVLMFRNADMGGTDDLSSDVLIQGNNGFAAVGRGRDAPPTGWRTSIDILPPLSGGVTVDSTTYFIQPINSVFLSEHSLQFLASFLLSSLVRYRPQIWQNAISRSVLNNSPADDRALALIERFLTGVLTDFPRLVVQSIDYLNRR